MKVAAAFVLLAASTASADTVLTLDGMLGIRSEALPDGVFPQPVPYAGARAIVSFEPPPPVLPAPGQKLVVGRVVPELLAGATFDDKRGEGFGGVGLRGDLVIASNDTSVKLRLAVYFAARAEVMGKDHDPAAELVTGTYLWVTPRFRLGADAGAVIRREHVMEAPGTTTIPANVIVNVTAGWAL